MSQRFRMAMEKAWKNIEERQWVYGQCGRINSDGTYTYDVPGRPGFIYVTVRNGAGAQTVVPARNDASVPHAPRLNIKLRLENGIYVIAGKSGRSELGSNPPSLPSGIEVHNHDDIYYRENEHLILSAGAADAGKPIALDADGHIDATMINDADIDHTAIANRGTNTHAQIDSHLANTSNPHGVTKAQVGLGSVDNVQQMPLSYLDLDKALTANSDVKVPSQKAIKFYVDNILSNANALVYKDTINCSTNPNYPMADAGFLYIVSAAGKIGGASGVTVDVGDMLICNQDGASSGDQATVGAYWNIIEKNIIGAVTGPASSTDGNLALFDGTTGKVIKNGNPPPANQAGAANEFLTAYNSSTGVFSKARPTAANVSDFNSAALAAAPAETTTTVGALINGATAKATPVDDDMVGLMDSAASNILKKLSWLNIKATLKAYFDSLYANAVGSAATFPVSPETGDYFIHSPTGRSILYLYNGTAWSPVQSLGDMTLYVDGASGSDVITKGTGTGANAFATIQYAIDTIPGTLNGNVTINIAAGTYAGAVEIKGKYYTGSYSITINGTLVSQEAISSATVAAGTGATQGTVTKTGAFTGNAYANMLVYFATDATYNIIDSHTNDVLTLVGTAASSTTQNVTVYDWGTVITGSFGVTGGQSGIALNNIHFNSSASAAMSSSSYSDVSMNQCKLTGNTTTGALLLQTNSRTSPTACYFYNNVTNGKGCQLQTQASVTFRKCKFNSVSVTGQGVYNVQPGLVSLQQGCIINGFTTGIAAIANLTVQIGTTVSTGYQVIRNCTTGISVGSGAVVSGTANNQYSGNTTNEVVSSDTLGYMDKPRTPTLLYVSAASIANPINTETNIASYTVPAGLMSVDGDSIWFEAWGAVTPNATDKFLKAYWGTNTIMMTVDFQTEASLWKVRGRIFRTGATSQRSFVDRTFEGVSPDLVGFYNLSYHKLDCNQTLSNTVTLRLTGSSSVANYIKCDGFIVGWEPNNT